LLSPLGISAFTQALAALRPSCRALMTPQSVVLDSAQGRQPQLERSGMSAASVEAQFSASVTILLGLLDKSKVRRRRLQVAISDHWTRPLVLSLTVKPQNDQAVDALLHSHYRKIYGDLMDNWRWCVDPARRPTCCRSLARTCT